MSEVTATRRARWTPEPGQRLLLRTGGSEEVRAEIDLDHLELTLPEGGEPAVRLRFTVPYGDLLQMEGRRWFGLPVGFIEQAGIPFVPDRPIVVEAATRPLERFGIPLSPHLVGVAPGDELAALLAPFFDLEREPTINNPLIYEVVRVSQPGPDGVGPVFDRATVEAWERRS